MEKRVEVMEIKNDSNWGLIAGCSAPEWNGMDEAEISNWFEERRKLAFDNGAIVEFSCVIPFATACFSEGKGQAVLRLDEPPRISISTPAIAHLRF